MDKIIPSWLDQPCRDLALSVERGRAPQALLIHGVAGIGRRHVARWFAAHLLKMQSAPGPTDLDADLVHPDFLAVHPVEEKLTISVAQVRDLIGFLQLTSHRGGARVVLCHPAEALTREAANSLLKTLEEPPRGSTIILVSANPAGLPATILSRCQRLRIVRPTREAALSWLSQQEISVQWELLLDFAAGAPLGALALQRAGFASQAGQMADDLQALRRRQATPVAVARKWARSDREILLRWLYLQAAASISRPSAGPDGNLVRALSDAHLQNPQKPRNMRAQFERLREAEGLYADRSRALNPELQLSALLQRWYGDAVAE